MIDPVEFMNQHLAIPSLLKSLARLRWLPLFLLAGLGLSACQAMFNMPRYEPLEASEFFPDRRSARPLVENTVPWNSAGDSSLLVSGLDENNEPSEEYPFPITAEVLQRGQERYDIFCAPCHNLTGDGQGWIVQRGFPAPPSFHEEELQDIAPGRIVDVIVNGFGQMYAYEYRVQPDDRWAVAAYVKALQFSQNAPLDMVPEEERQNLEDVEP